VIDSVTIGPCTLYHGDCRDILPSLGPVDCVLTDPPYGIRYARQPTKWSRDKGHRAAESWDNITPDMTDILSLKVPTMIWGGNHFQLPSSRGWLVWTKPNGLPTYGNAELCWTNLSMPVRHKYECWVRPKPRLHPTQKSETLMQWCLSFVPDAKTVLDPFMGSATTGAACIHTGRQFVGIEKDAAYFDIACDRLTREWNAKKPQRELIPA
jgi:site-specific DNA-methyltransferase (adenine-specific)